MKPASTSHETEIAQLTRIFADRRAAGRRTKHAQDVRRRVVALTSAGISKQSLADQFGITSTLIWKWEQNQITRPNAPKVVPIRPPQAEQSLELKSTGTPLRLQLGSFIITIETQQGA